MKVDFEYINIFIERKHFYNNTVDTENHLHLHCKFTMKSRMLFGCADGLQCIVTTAALLVAACCESAQLIKYMKAQIKMCPCF